MEEILVDDKVINPPPTTDKQTDTSDSFFVGPDLQNLLNLFVRQSKENEEEITEVNSVEISEVNIGESITLYSEKMDSSLAALVSPEPTAPSVPEQIVKMMMPLDFGTATPGDDLLATLVSESVEDSRITPSPSHGGESSSSKICLISPGQEVFRPQGPLGPLGHPAWVKEKYPEIYREWEAVSGAPVFQGKVRMFCSRCRDRPSQGFLQGVPVCESCRLEQACTVCQLRVSSTFSYGLALCEADRQFLFRTFSQQPELRRCEARCAVTVSGWCGYCRLRACLTTKGFRFFVQASTHHLMSSEEAPDRKRKYSGEGVYKELSFVSDAVSVDSLDAPAAKKTNIDVKSGSDEAVFVKPPTGSVIVRSTSRSSKNSRANTRAQGEQSQAGPSSRPPSSSSNKSAEYYDGSRLGLSNKKKTPGLLNDPASVSWVLQQQEKFLKHHMELFYKRRNSGKQ